MMKYLYDDLDKHFTVPVNLSALQILIFINICSADGTVETGKIIINELQKLGGIDTGRYCGNGSACYFINKEGNIDHKDSLPKSYTVVDINNFKTIVPTNDIDSLFEDIAKLENIMKNLNDDINIKISDIKKRIQKILIDKQ